jgi:hypothetical protein
MPILRGHILAYSPDLVHFASLPFSNSIGTSRKARLSPADPCHQAYYNLTLDSQSWQSARGGLLDQNQAPEAFPRGEFSRQNFIPLGFLAILKSPVATWKARGLKREGLTISYDC